jgi:hypothetical protein
VGTGRVGVRVGSAADVGTGAGVVTVAAGAAALATGEGLLLTIAGATGGGPGGPELKAIVPVPTRMPMTLAPSSRDSPRRAATGMRRRCCDVSPSTGAAGGIPVPA